MAFMITLLILHVYWDCTRALPYPAAIRLQDSIGLISRPLSLSILPRAQSLSFSQCYITCISLATYALPDQVTSHFGLPVSHAHPSCGPETLLVYLYIECIYNIQATGLHLLPGSPGSLFHGQLLSMVSTASNTKDILMSLEESWLYKFQHGVIMIQQLPQLNHY